MDKKKAARLFKEFPGLRLALEFHCQESGLEFRLGNVEHIRVQRLDARLLAIPVEIEVGVKQERHGNSFAIGRVFVLTGSRIWSQIYPNPVLPLSEAINRTIQPCVVAIVAVWTECTRSVIGSSMMKVEHCVQICRRVNHQVGIETLIPSNDSDGKK